MITAKQTITETFIHLLSEQDFEAVSVKDIVAYAGISRSTFYLHFTDKYELMDAVRNQLNGRILQIYAEPSDAETINLKICRHVFRYRSFYRQEFSDAGRIHQLTIRLAEQLEHVFATRTSPFSLAGALLAIWPPGSKADLRWRRRKRQTN